MKRLLRICAALAIGAALASCSLQPTYERPPLPVAGTYPAGAAYASGAASGELPAADIGWRDFLTDPRLARLVELALANNRDLRVATLNVALARAQYRIQRSGRFPEVGAFADASLLRTPASLPPTHAAQVTKSYSAGITASWELDLFGKLQSESDAALEQYFASGQARKAAQLALVAEVADQYLTLLAADALVEVTLRTQKTAEASLRLTTLQFDNGVGSELAVRQSQTVVEQAKANYATQVRLRAQAENALVLLVGQPLPEDLPAGYGLQSQSVLADVPAGVPSDLLVRRPDIAQAEALLRASNANIGAARAAFFPSIALTGNVGAASSTLAGLFHPGALAWSFLPSLAQPIFEAGRLEANLDASKVQKDIAIAQYEKTIETAFREVADGLAARGTYDDQVASLARFVEAQRRTLTLSEMRFRNGVDSYINVLTAQTGLYSAEQALVAARLGRLVSLVDLYRALGGGWIERTGDAPRPPTEMGALAADAK
jgi:multidrug efflux system outer membrane protein